MLPTTYRSIFISDVHLGTRDSQADRLNNFLKHNSCDTLYLVGDIIDAWKIQQNKWQWKQSHTNVVRRVLGHAKRGTRVIYIAGNEEFNQGGIGYESACAVAKNKNVIVNTIFCGKRSEGINTFWKHAADLTGGNFASINSDAKTVHYKSPYDVQISNLNVELNSTYVSFNKIGIDK